MKLLETFVYINAKDDAMKAGLKSASKYARGEVREMQKVFDSLKIKAPDFRAFAAGAAAMWGLKSAVDNLIGSTVKAGSSFNDMSARTGVAVETLSALSHAAILTGSDMNAVEKSIRYLTNTMLDASRGQGEAVRSFRELNIAVTDSRGSLRPAIDVMMDAADVIGRMTNETAQAAYASELFGARTGTAMIPILKEGKEGIRGMMEEAKRLGIVMSTEDAAAADEAGDAMDIFTASLEGVKRSIAVGVLPSITSFIKSTTELLVANRELIRVNVAGWLDKIGDGMKFLWSHRDTIKTVFEAAAIVFITTKIYALSQAVIVLAGALTALGTSAGLSALIAAGAPLAALATAVTALGLVGMNKFETPPTVSEFNKKITSRYPSKDETEGDYQNIRASIYRSLKGRSYGGGTIDARTLGYDITRGTIVSPGVFDEVPRITGTSPTGGLNRGGAGSAAMFQMQMSSNLLGLSEFTNTGMLGSRAQFTPGADFGKYKAGWYRDDYMKEIEQIRQEDLDSAAAYANEYIDTMNDMWSSAKGAALEYSQYWGAVMGSMYEQANGSFRRILDSFRNMLASMAVQGVFTGLLNMIVGGPGGFMGGLTSVFSGLLPKRASGGPVFAGSPYMVGERGPEVFVPRQSGSIIPNGAGTVDNSRWTLIFNDTAGERKRMTYDEDAIFAAKFKRCVRDGRITMKAG